MPKKTPGKSIKVLQVLKKKQFRCFFVLCFPWVFDPTFAGGVTSPFGLSNQHQNWMISSISSWNTQLYRVMICWKKIFGNYQYLCIDTNWTHSNSLWSFGRKEKCVVQNHRLETVTLRQKKLATWHVVRKHASLKSEMSIINDLGMSQP